MGGCFGVIVKGFFWVVVLGAVAGMFAEWQENQKLAQMSPAERKVYQEQKRIVEAEAQKARDAEQQAGNIRQYIKNHFRQVVPSLVAYPETVSIDSYEIEPVDLAETEWMAVVKFRAENKFSVKIRHSLIIEYRVIENKVGVTGALLDGDRINL